MRKKKQPDFCTHSSFRFKGNIQDGFTLHCNACRLETSTPRRDRAEAIMCRAQDFRDAERDAAALRKAQKQRETIGR